MINATSQQKALNISVTPPTAADRNGIIKRLSLRYRRISPEPMAQYVAAQNKTVEDNSQELPVTFQLTNLEEYAIYEVRVQACTAVQDDVWCSDPKESNYTTESAGEFSVCFPEHFPVDFIVQHPMLI